MKKVITWFIGILIAFALISVVLVNSWRDTGHGKLNYKVAIILKLMELSGEPARPSVAEGRKNLLKTVNSYSADPVNLPKIINQTIPGLKSNIPIRIYIPMENKILPVVIYFHGGGWVQGNLDSHDNLVRYLAYASNNIVVSVDYRLAPENPFPAAIEDSYSTLKWVAANAGTFGGDPMKIAVAGDSAGANLSAVISLMAREKNGPMISRQILLYPSTNVSTLDTISFKHFGRGFMLTKSDIEWFRGHYVPNRSSWSNPLVSPLLAKSHYNLPPATIITAQMDPLREDGKLYAEKLKKAGISVNYHSYDGMIHGFISADKVLSQAHEALDEVAADLKKTYQTHSF